MVKEEDIFYKIITHEYNDRIEESERHGQFRNKSGKSNQISRGRGRGKGRGRGRSRSKKNRA